MNWENIKAKSPDHAMLKAIYDLMDNGSCGGMDSVVSWKGHMFPIGIGKAKREKWIKENAEDLFLEGIPDIKEAK